MFGADNVGLLDTGDKLKARIRKMLCHLLDIGIYLDAAVTWKARKLNINVG